MSIDARRRKTHAKPSGDSKTRQADAAGSSVSDIVARHVPGAPIGDPRATRMPKFLNMSSDTLQDLLNRATDAKLAFQGLSARLKGKFSNDPVTMLRWCEVPENRQEGIKLGLIVPTPEEAHKLAQEAAKARRGEQVDLIREAMRPDPEAQPNYNTPKGGKGGATA